MDAVAALQQVFSVQHAFKVLAVLSLTAYLFPKQAAVKDDQEFDFIVVGAGSAGVVVAYRLAECNFRVLLIDAGGDPPVPSLVPSLFPTLSHTEADWNFTNIPLKDRFLGLRDQTLNLTSGHVLGGGSSINYMFYVRGCPGDFSEWAKAAKNSTWDYDGMLPYFIKSERYEDREILSSRYRKYHGTKGFLGVTRDNNPKVDPYLEAFKELGNNIILDINGDRSLGYTRTMFTIAEGVRQSTAYSILAKYKNPNLEVLRHTFVTNILFDRNKNANGVKATTEDNKVITVRARNEVIVSAGSFNTARLLMSSGIGPKDHLNSLKIPVINDLPVGKNLQDHVPVIMSFKMEESNEPPPPLDPHKFPFPSFEGYVALNKSEMCPTYQSINLLVPAGSKFPLQLCVFNYNFDFDICQNLYEGGKTRNTMLTIFSLLHPKSRGRVLLRSDNPRDPPIINVNYLGESEDLETLVDSLIDFVQVLNTTLFRSAKSEMVDLKLPLCQNLEFMSRNWWRCYVRTMSFTIYHYSGTCAMGSVVDSDLRVFGVGRLRVIDASIMPQVVGANTNAAVIAIGEKGAAFIKKDYCCQGNPWSDFINHKFNFG